MVEEAGNQFRRWRLKRASIRARDYIDPGAEERQNEQFLQMAENFKQELAAGHLMTPAIATRVVAADRAMTDDDLPAAGLIFESIAKEVKRMQENRKPGRDSELDETFPAYIPKK